MLGTPIDTIILTEDRELFAQAMAEIGEKCAKSASATDMDSAMKAGVYVGTLARPRERPCAGAQVPGAAS